MVFLSYEKNESTKMGSTLVWHTLYGVRGLGR